MSFCYFGLFSSLNEGSASPRSNTWTSSSSNDAHFGEDVLMKEHTKYLELKFYGSKNGFLRR